MFFLCGPRFTHDFFFERDYPDTSMLEKDFRAPHPPAPQTKEAVKARVKLAAADAFDIAMEKLWIHGGAVLDYAENFEPGQGRLAHFLSGRARSQRWGQFEKMLFYCPTAATLPHARALVNYFGDTGDSCSSVAAWTISAIPGGGWGRISGLRMGRSKAHIARILEFSQVQGMELRRAASTRRSPRTEGLDAPQLRRSCFAAMARGGLIEVISASFEKDGKQIDFRKVRITRAGRRTAAVRPARIPYKMTSERGTRCCKRKEGRFASQMITGGLGKAKQLRKSKLR